MKKKLLSILALVIISCVCLFTLTACENGDNSGDTPPAHEHSFTNYISDNNATCTVNGTETATCDNCDAIDTREIADSKLGHSFTNYISDNNATCTANGTETATCDNCIETDTREKLNSKLGHSFTNYVSDNNASYESDGTKTAKCDNCEATDTINDDGTKLISHISFKTLEVNGSVVNGGKVSNATNQFNFNDEIEVNGYATYVVALDEFGINQAYTKVVPLSVGDNVIYIFESVNNQITKTYEVTIRRRPMHNVSFNTLGSYVESQSIEEDSLATEPTIIPTRAGYTFNGWNYDFTTPITGYTTIDAKWTANTDTQYKVEYYLQNLNGYDYTIDNSLTENLTGTTDTTANAEIKEIEHFTAESQTVSGNINGNGTTVLKVYYQRNEYTLTIVFGNGEEDKVITQYYNSEITEVLPNEVERAGFTFNGWDKQIPTSMPAQNTTINAKWLAIFIHYNGEITELTSHGKTLSEIVIPDKIDGVAITKISSYAFYDCDSLTSIEIPDSVTSIGEYAFYDCTSLTSVTISNGVTGIGSSAFYNCSSLTSIEIPDSVTSIGNYAFEYCDSLTKVNYLGTIDGWAQIEFSSSASNPLYYAKNLYINDVLVTEVVITSATKISSYAFTYCSSLTSVVIPDSVTSIGSYAFYDCDSLTSIVIPDSVTSIGNQAFYACDSLTSVVIGDSVTSIGEYAFYDCDSLTSIEIPDSVTSIGEYAFYDCTSLTSITVDKNNPNYKSIDGNLYSKDGKTLIQYAIGKNDTAFIIPNSVTSIGDYAFRDCDSLTSVVIGDSVTSIGDDAFKYCRSLTSIEIPDSVTSIGEYAFSGCSKLTSIVIPDSVTSIGSSAFSGCSSLNYNVKDNLKYLGNSENPYLYLADTTSTSITTATIDNKCKFIGSYAFYYCESLTSIEMPNSVTSIGDVAFRGCSSLTSIEIGNNVASIGNSAFRDCSSLNYNVKDNLKYLGNSENPYLYLAGTTSTSITTATIDNKCKFIGTSAFSYCKSLTSIVIPDSVTSIGSSAFSYCKSLTSIEIPDSVTSIGPDAFEGCDSLTSIVIPDSVTSIGSDAFYNCYKLVEVINNSPNITVEKGSSSNGYLGYYALSVSNRDSTYVSKLSTDSNGYVIYTEGSDKILVNYVGSQTKLTLPSSITEIKNYAFYNNDKLVSVVITNSVTSIGNSAFSGCDSLTSVVIGDSVTSIGSYAFSGCDSLTSIKYRGTEEEWSAIDKGNNWDYNTGRYTIEYNYTGN